MSSRNSRTKCIYEKKLSEKTTGSIFEDGHVEISVKLPWPLGTHSLVIEANELDVACDFLNRAIAYRKKLAGITE